MFLPSPEHRDGMVEAALLHTHRMFDGLCETALPHVFPCFFVPCMGFVPRPLFAGTQANNTAVHPSTSQ
jgi:hypothetical protein